MKRLVDKLGVGLVSLALAGSVYSEDVSVKGNVESHVEEGSQGGIVIDYIQGIGRFAMKSFSKLKDFEHEIKELEKMKRENAPKQPVEYFLTLLGKERVATIKNKNIFTQFYQTSGGGGDGLCEIYKDPEKYLKEDTTLKPKFLLDYIKNLPEKDKNKLEEWFWKINTEDPSLDDAILVYIFKKVLPATSFSK